MVNKMVSIVTTVIVLATAPAAIAQQEKGHRPPPPEKVIERLDTDKDGKISKAEADKAERGRMKEHFDKIDSNGDGFIEAKELGDFHKKMRENRRNNK